MNILWLNANLLLPLDKGGKLRTWHLMRELARHHKITYISFADPGRPPELDRGMRDVCAELETVERRDAEKGTWRFYAGAAARLLDPLPYAVAKYRSPEFAGRVRDALASRRFDLVVCDFLVPFVNMPARLPCPAVLFTHNVEAEIWRRHAETCETAGARALYRSQWRRMQRFERLAVSRFDLVLAVSNADRTTLLRLYGDALRAPVRVVQTGVDTEYFSPPPADAVAPRHLVFTGSMDWLPNEDGVRYFCSEILPRIRRLEPDATFSIVGRAPTPAVRELAGRVPGVEVTGRVDDVRPHMARGALYVVPLRIGGGTRLKIFEAMAMGKAIVSTTVGAEGLPLTAGRDIAIADDPGHFASTTVHLLRDDELRRRIEAQARRLVVEQYDWSAVAQGLNEALERAAEGARGTEQWSPALAGMEQ
jgi:sugar transferase (PEP-CTERM/EpsH1 system associated)